MEHARTSAEQTHPWFVRAMMLLTVLGAFAVLSTLSAVGTTWDDAIELIALRTELALIRDGAADYAAAAKSIHYLNAFYGIVPAGIAHVLAWVIGIEPLGDVAFTAPAFFIRHIVAFCCAVGAVASLGLTVWQVSRRASFAWAVAAILAWLPMFAGHAAINIKDMPVAAGMTLAGCGLALLLRGAARRGMGAEALVTLGVVLAVGTRGGIVAPMALIFLVCTVSALLLRGRAALAPMLRSGIAFALGVVVVMATNPVAWYGPVRWMIDCVMVSARYPAYGGSTLVFSHLVPARDQVWWYVPAWLLVQIPLEVMVLLAVGLLALARSARHRLDLVWLPLLCQGLLLPVVIVMAHANLFNALRHLLFMIPPLAVLAGWGMDRLLIAGRGKARFGLVLLVCLAGESAIWAPYQYAYLNPIGLAAGGARAFEGDYWGISGREGGQLLRERGAQAVIVGPGDTGLPFGAGTQNGDVALADGYYAFSFQGRIGLTERAHFAGPCARAFVIARFGHRLGEGFMCRAAP